MTEGCGAECVGLGGFSKEAKRASKSLSGEAFLSASLCGVVDTGAHVCVDSEELDWATGVAAESDDHHQPMV
jgi:hypothetical protein